MEFSMGSLPRLVANATTAIAGRASEAVYRMGTCRYALVFGLLAVAACLPLAPHAFGQIQSTTSCPGGRRYWDVLV